MRGRRASWIAVGLGLGLVSGCVDRPALDDVAATVKQTEAIGGEIVMPGEETPYGTLAVIKDPLGALICLGHPPAGMS